MDPLVRRPRDKHEVNPLDSNHPILRRKHMDRVADRRGTRDWLRVMRAKQVGLSYHGLSERAPTEQIVVLIKD